MRLQRGVRRGTSAPGSSRRWSGTAARGSRCPACRRSPASSMLARPALARGVDHREVQGVLAVAVVEQVHEQLVGLVDDLGDPGVGPVDLVHHEHDGQVGVERLAEHEPGLRERALGGVHQQHDAVDHGQAALDLATEVGVARGVDDVDRHRTALDRLGRGAGVADRGVLREDRDALLALEVTGVHRPLVDVLVLAEGAALPEHRVHEGGLAVVDVRHDGDVAEVGAVRVFSGMAGQSSLSVGSRRSASCAVGPAPGDDCGVARRVYRLEGSGRRIATVVGVITRDPTPRRPGRGRLAGRRVHRRRHLHRVGHPGLPLAGRGLDALRPARTSPSAGTSSRPRSAHGRGGCGASSSPRGTLPERRPPRAGPARAGRPLAAASSPRTSTACTRTPARARVVEVHGTAREVMCIGHGPRHGAPEGCGFRRRCRLGPRPASTPATPTRSARAAAGW